MGPQFMEDGPAAIALQGEHANRGMRVQHRIEAAAAIRCRDPGDDDLRLVDRQGAVELIE